MDPTEMRLATCRLAFAVSACCAALALIGWAVFWSLELMAALGCLGLLASLVASVAAPRDQPTQWTTATVALLGHAASVWAAHEYWTAWMVQGPGLHLVAVPGTLTALVCSAVGLGSSVGAEWLRAGTEDGPGRPT